MIKMKNGNLKRFFMGVSVLLIYGIMALTNLQALPFSLLKIDLATVPYWIKVVYSIFYQLLILFLIAFIFRKELKKDFEDLKQNHKTYFKKYLKYWFLMLALMMISNLFIQIVLPNQIAGNEEQIREMFKVSPIYIFISSVLIAPFLEELVFRLGIRHVIKNDILFILVSGLVFGSLHVFGNVEVPLDYLYIIPYSIPGFIFAYILTKSKNIFTTMGLHFLHNGILMSLQFLIYFLI